MLPGSTRGPKAADTPTPEACYDPGVSAKFPQEILRVRLNHPVGGHVCLDDSSDGALTGRDHFLHLYFFQFPDPSFKNARQL